MAKKEEDRLCDGGSGKGAVYVVGIGPGNIEHLTGRAKEALERADAIVGYTRYVQLISGLTSGKEVYSTGMTHEVERCSTALGLARQGKTVAVVSSGDSGIYGMAGLILQLSLKDSAGPPVRIEVIPGLPAFVAAASILGAPLMHDFASVSLSDLLTEWGTIEKRLEAASIGDFVIVLYNPKSSKRIEGLTKAIDIISRHRSGETPVGIVRNAAREGQEAVITTLRDVSDYFDDIDMLTILIIGNATSFIEGGRIVTPRGYGV